MYKMATVCRSAEDGKDQGRDGVWSMGRVNPLVIFMDLPYVYDVLKYKNKVSVHLTTYVYRSIEKAEHKGGDAF